MYSGTFIVCEAIINNGSSLVCEDRRGFIKSPEESLKIKTKHVNVGIRSTIFPCDKNSMSKLWLVGPVYKG